MQSKDMRAPLAVLSMLWYHVLMRPFITEKFTDEDINEIVEMIGKHQEQYPKSAFFLFFQGRVCRLQKDLDGAIGHYEKAKVRTSKVSFVHSDVCVLRICKLLCSEKTKVHCLKTLFGTKHMKYYNVIIFIQVNTRILLNALDFLIRSLTPKSCNSYMKALVVA